LQKFILVAAFSALLAGPAVARNLAFPADNPAATVTVPDNWKTDEIEYGYSAMSPDKDVFFSLESAGKNKVDAMMANNKQWMKENGIDGSVQPKVSEGKFGGLPAKLYEFDTKDENGPTTVEFILMPAEHERLLFVTLWGSEEERGRHTKEIDAITSSFKAIQ
jgi:hypothetical protein